MSDVFWDLRPHAVGHIWIPFNGDGQKKEIPGRKEGIEIIEGGRSKQT